MTGRHTEDRPDGERRDLFDGVSLSQVIAGAGAAATSMVLASQIGIAGSVIGAAISSVVTVVCSQLYRRFLTASAQKLKGGAEVLGMRDDGAGDRSSASRAGSDASETATPDEDGGRLRGASAERGDRASDGLLETRSLGADAPDPGEADGRRGPGAPPSPLGAARTGSYRDRVDEHRARVAPVPLRIKVAAERKRTQRKITLFSVAIAIIAVALCAWIIFFTTQGKGLGYRTAPIFQPATERRERPEGDQAGTPATERESGSGSAPRTDDGARTGGGDQGGSSNGGSSDPTSGETGGSGGGENSPDSGGGDGGGADAGGSASS